MKLTKIALIFVNIVLVVIFAKFFIADASAKRIDYATKNLEFEKALKKANQAIKLNPHEPYYYRQRAKVFVLLATEEQVDKKIYKEQALNDLQTGYSLNKDNLATMRNSIPYYYFLAKDDFAIQQEPNTKAALGPDFAPKTLAVYKSTKNRFSSDAGAIATIAKYEKILGFDEEYAKSVNLLKKLRPDLLEWYPGIAY